MVADTSPPMTTTASGRWISEPCPVARSSGISPKPVILAVIITGLKRRSARAPDPPAAIKANLQVLQGARTEVERNEFIAALAVSVDRSTRLVAQLMTLSRLDPQQQRPAVLGPVDLS
jgi:hypothetical protein